MEDIVTQTFGHRLRVRVCGICIHEDKVLLLRHRSIGDGQWWGPPGGGLQYGEETTDALRREFVEETGLTVEIRRFLFVHEYLDPPLHGIELFFEVTVTGGLLQKGYDPEMSRQDQIIEEFAFKSFDEILALPPARRHHIFSFCRSVPELLAMQGLYRLLPGQ